MWSLCVIYIKTSRQPLDIKVWNSTNFWLRDLFRIPTYTVVGLTHAGRSFIKYIDQGEHRVED